MNFITGNKFKKISDFILDENGFRKTDVNNKIPIFFVKIDFIEIFYNNFVPNNPFKIITHNGDNPIDYRYLKILNNDKLIHWYGQNVNIQHNKLSSIPIGIANEIWEHGNEDKLLIEISGSTKKTNLIYCNFDINTNPIERNKCLISMRLNNLNMSERQKFTEYLSELNKSFFSLSPNGNGIDCHKTWESFYLKTIPIVTKSINMEFYKDYPVLIIDNWESFDISTLSIELYQEIIKKYDDNKLDFSFFEKKCLSN